MIVGKKYQKRPTIAVVTQIDGTTAGDYGVLGTLTSGDAILQMASGFLHTIPASTLSNDWILANDNSTLTGTDYN